MSGVLRRVGAFFLDSADGPGDAPREPARRASVATNAAGGPIRAAVLGAPGVAVPLAAACAGELRARQGSGAALLCVWRPDGRRIDPDAEPATAGSPAGATTPAARRLAAGLVAHGLPATACGRLAWLSLPADPGVAVGLLRRCLPLAEVPLVIAVAGARPMAFEALLAELALGVAVLDPDAGPALRELTLAALPTTVRHLAPPLAPGPPRWAAMAGLARLRSLPGPAA